MVGFVIPCVLDPLFLLADLKAEGVWTWIFLIGWPTSFWAFLRGGSAIDDIVGFLTSACENAILYWFVGMIVSVVTTSFQRVIARRGTA